MSEIDDLSDEQAKEEEQLDLQFQPQNENGKPSQYSCFIVLFVVAVLLVIIALCAMVVLANSQNKPDITILYNHQSVGPLRDVPSSAQSALNKYKSNLSKLNQSLTILRLDEVSQVDLIKIESTNQQHRIYQQSTRNLNWENMQKLLDDFRLQLIDVSSSISYEHYLKALKFMLLTTYPINHRESGLDKLMEEEAKYYLDKYKFKAAKDLNICVITTLTHSGLQSGDYYYLLKSIYQQNYTNYKHIVVNYPKMHMDDEINKMLSIFDKPLKRTTLVNLTYEGRYELGAAIYTVLHQHCDLSDVTIFLRDTGQLIGRNVFRIMSELHQSKSTNIVFSTYLLTTRYLFSSSQNDFKYKIQLYPQNLSSPRQQQYKTKYLKSYTTKLLLKLPEATFQDSLGKWKDKLSQSSLQFAALEANCGKYHLVQQLLFIATPRDIQSEEDVYDSQSHAVVNCQSSVGLPSDPTYSQQNQLRDNP